MVKPTDVVIFTDMKGHNHNALVLQLWHDAAILAGDYPGVSVAFIEPTDEDAFHVQTAGRVPHVSKMEEAKEFSWQHPTIKSAVKVPANTEITMGDGGHKRAADLKPGDEIQTPNGPATVSGVDKPKGAAPTSPMAQRAAKKSSAKKEAHGKAKNRATK